jgi:hypothetical protein
LDASYSNGKGLAYQWTVKDPDSSEVSLNNPTSVKPTFTPMKEGRYSVKLTVTDKVGQTDAYQDEIDVEKPDIAALFDASPQFFELEDKLNVKSTLDASQSRGVNLAYNWKVLQNPSSQSILSTKNGVETTIRFPVEGDYKVQLKVEDPLGQTDTATKEHTAQCDDYEYDCTAGCSRDDSCTVGLEGNCSSETRQCESDLICKDGTCLKKVLEECSESQNACPRGFKCESGQCLKAKGTDCAMDDECANDLVCERVCSEFCPEGCYDGYSGNCLPGTHDDNCGTNGDRCTSCGPRKTCQNGRCIVN